MEKIKVELLGNTNIKVLKKALEKPYKSQFSDNNFENIAFNVINKLKHESVAEHINFSFDLLGISRLCLQELARHRIASYTVESTRFTLQKFIKECKPDSLKEVEKFFVIPQNSNIEMKVSLMLQAEDFYMRSTKNLELGNDYIKYLLPESFRTNLTMTINIRSLFNFFELRLGNENNNPHFEIKHLARLMLDNVLQTEYKFLFERFINEK